MFKINLNTKKLQSIPTKTFREIETKERQDLQEWIVSNPLCLWEDLLIIQKEFDGFNDTRERLDLLALDKQWVLVIIENKTDDTGRDVTWQALKYVSYCSTLTKKDIIDMYQSYLDKYYMWQKAEDKLMEFFDGQDIQEIEINQWYGQRTILVAGSFRKEVTSTVLRLLQYNIRMQCIKASIYQDGDELFLDMEQILPIQDAEEYMISVANKNQEDVQQQEQNKSLKQLHREFRWLLLPKVNKNVDTFSNVNPTDDHWLGAGSWVSGVPYTFVITKNYAMIELAIMNKPTQEECKKIYDDLFIYKGEIEQKFWHELSRERLDDGKGSRVAFYLKWVSKFERKNRPKIMDFFLDNIKWFIEATQPYLFKVAK